MIDDAFLFILDYQLVLVEADEIATHCFFQLSHIVELCSG